MTLQTAVWLLLLVVSQFTVGSQNQDDKTMEKRPKNRLLFRNPGSDKMTGPFIINDNQWPITLSTENGKGERTSRVKLGLNIHKPIQVFKRDEQLSIVTDTFSLTLSQVDECVELSWKALVCVTEVLKDCMELGSDHWYGGAEMKLQAWPLENVQHAMTPYIGQDTLGTSGYGPVQERLFFSSSGVGIYVPEDIPLFVSLNNSGDGNLCLEAKFDQLNYMSINNSLPELNYTICKASNVRDIYELMSNKYIAKPVSTINLDLFRRPIWSTWAEYKTNISQSKVTEFVESVIQRNLSISQIEIDDKWTSSYGDLHFDAVKFPDPKGMVDSLHSQNISVTFWVHPFVNVDSDAFNMLASKGWMIQDMSGKRPALTSWWNGQLSGHIDFSNPDASNWFLDLIGGNMYDNNLDAELFIRWIQANALMPIMQFSLTPWRSNNSTVLEVAQDMVKLHEKYSNLIVQLADESVTTGFPIMRPLWWIAPTDEAALTVDDQFLLGNDLLVAPVVEQGQTIRSLYLPAGRWRDVVKGHVYDGGKWIDYPVTLRDLPYFIKKN